MSLQGSLDTFALPDVLLLLAGTKKSGELYVAGHRSAPAVRPPEVQGRVWFEEGNLVGCEVPRAAEPVEAVFELLRLVEGTFSFVIGSPAQPLAPQAVEPVLTEAQARLVEWQEIERVVPSLAAWLALAGEPPAAHVAMRGDQWRMVAAVGGGCEVEAALAHLELGELPGCRAVKELVEAGLVTLTREEDREPAAPRPSTSAPAGAPQDTDWRVDTAGAWSRNGAEPTPPWLSAVPAEGQSEPAPVVGVASPEPPTADLTVVEGEVPAGDPWGAKGWQLDPADDVASLVTFPDRLAPAKTAKTAKTAKAAASPAAAAPAPAEQPAADTAEAAEGEAAEDGEEPLNRGLLLKFLSSVKN